MVKDFVKKFIIDSKYLMNLTLEVTSQCNLRCCHCYIENRLSSSSCWRISLQKIKEVVNEARKLNAITVVITGGEPMMHPNFFDIVKFVKEIGFIVFLKTNGTMINSRNVKLLKENVDNIILSRYGCSRETYEAVTGVSGSYNRYCKTLRLLNQYKIPYEQNAILLKENECEIEEFINSGYNIEQYISIHKDDNYAEIHRPSDAALHKYYFAELTRPDFNYPHIFEVGKNPFVCNCGTCSLTVTSQGNIVPCTNFNFVLGNINVDSLKDVWYSQKKISIMNSCKADSFEACKKCKNNMYLLSMGPCNNYTETGDINQVGSEMCRHCSIVKAVSDELENKRLRSSV